MDQNDEYSAKLVSEIYQAIVRASVMPDGSAVVKSGPAFEALITVAAIMVCRAPDFEKSAVVRAVADDMAKKFRKQVAIVQQNPELASLFGTAVDPHLH